MGVGKTLACVLAAAKAGVVVTLKILAALMFLATNYYAYYHLAKHSVVPEREQFVAFPKELGPFSCATNQVMSEKIENNLGVTDYLLCDFQSVDRSQFVNVYIGYHEVQARVDGGGTGVKAIHPPKHCLPGSGWNIIEHEKPAVSLPGLPEQPARVNRLVIAKGNARRLVYYWYQSRGRVIADDWKKIVALTWDRGMTGRTDGSLVRFTIPIVRDEIESADQVFFEIAEPLMRELPKFVPN